MEIVLILFLTALIVISLFLMYHVLKWCFAKKIRATVISSIAVFICLSFVIHRLFFTKMEFIQSKVYSDLYLIKHPVQQIDSVHQTVKQFIKNKLEMEKETFNYKDSLQYVLRFYKYTKNWGINFFQDAGTVYFIENKEDLGGFVSEELGMYTQHRIAFFYLDFCKKDSTAYCGELNYFLEGDFLKAETITLSKNQ